MLASAVMPNLRTVTDSADATDGPYVSILPIRTRSNILKFNPSIKIMF